MNLPICQLRSAKNFAQEMVFKYIDLLKEWQHRALNTLNDYCRGNIDVKDFLTFVKTYNKVLLCKEHWEAELSHLNYELNCLKQGVKSYA